MVGSNGPIKGAYAPRVGQEPPLHVAVVERRWPSLALGPWRSVVPKRKGWGTVPLLMGKCPKGCPQLWHERCHQPVAH